MLSHHQDGELFNTRQYQLVYLERPMPVSNIVRNLRDGELTLIDGSNPPQRLLVVLDEGDLTWTERLRTIEVKDRGSIASGQLRRGEDESVALSFTARWTQLLGKSLTPTDPLQLYELLALSSAAGVKSTSPAGEQQTLTLEFRVNDPAGTASEVIRFSRVYRETLRLSEGNETNTIAFTGKSFVTAPIVSRAA